MAVDPWDSPDLKVGLVGADNRGLGRGRTITLLT